MAGKRKIKTACCHCEAQRDYPAGALRLVQIETTHYHLAYTYEFFCGTCKQLCVEHIAKGVFNLLRENGVPVIVRCGVDEIAEIWARDDHAPLKLEDVEGWLEDLALLPCVPEALVEHVTEAESKIPPCS